MSAPALAFVERVLARFVQDQKLWLLQVHWQLADGRVVEDPFFFGRDRAKLNGTYRRLNALCAAVDVPLQLVPNKLHGPSDLDVISAALKGRRATLHFNHLGRACRYDAAPSDAAPPSDETNHTAGAAQEGRATLTTAHVDLLRERAIPVHVAALAGLRSVAPSEGGVLLGWTAPAPAGAIAIPYIGIAPPYWRLRMDGGPSRYLCPKGREVPLYVPSSILDTPEVDGDLADVIVVVEAPLKALALGAIGLHAVGLGGVSTTLGRDGRLNESWGRIELEDCRVIVCFDANRRTKPAVAQAEARLVAALQQSGAVVHVADLPALKDRPDAGPDDVIAASGAGVLLKVLGDAVPGDPLDRLAALEQANDRDAAERLLDDVPFIAAVLERGERVRAAATRTLHGLGVGKRTFDRAISSHKARTKKQTIEEPREEASDAPYTREDGRFVFIGGNPPRPVCNFVAEIVEDVTVDDGAEETREFVIQGQTADGRQLPRVTVDAREFASSSAVWVTAEWGSRAIVHADCMQHIRPAIQFFSNAKPSKQIAHTGWRKLDEHLVYLTAGGAIGASVEVTVRLDLTLRRYALPPASATRECVIEAVRMSLRILDVAPDSITIPALAAVYRAPLSEWLYCDAVVWLFGPSGALKSSLAALLLGHYGTAFDRERLTASWTDTVASLETKLFRAKDTLAIIDDFAPRGVDDRDELRRKAAQVIRGVGNGQSRSRMRADMTARADRPPRALVMSTAEDMPSGESVMARTFPIGMRREDVNLDALSFVQRNAHSLPIALRAFIEQIISWVAADADFASTMRRRFEDLRATFAARGHLRAPAAAAHLAIGWCAFLTFAEAVGAIDAVQVADLRRRGDDALQAQLEAQRTASHDEDAVRLFLRWLRSLIDAGRVHLEAQDVTLVPTPGRETIGWRTAEGKIHLLPDVAYSAVAKAMRESGDGMRVKGATLWVRLGQLGFVTPFEHDRLTVKRTHAGQRHRVVELLPHALEDDGPLPGGAGGPAADSGGATAEPKGADGAQQDAVSRTENGVRPGCPAPGGGGDDGGGNACARNLLDGRAHAVSEARDGGRPTGAIGAEEEEREEKSLSDKGLPAPPSPSSGWVVTGAPEGQPGRVVVVTDVAVLSDLAHLVERAGVVGLDAETTGLDPRRHRPRLVQLALPDGRVFLVDLFATKTLGPLAQAFGVVELVGHNLAFDLGFLSHHGQVVASRTFDTMLASQILDCGLNRHTKGHHSLAGVLARVLNVTIDKAERSSDWSGGLSDSQLAYAANDVAHLLSLGRALAKQLIDRSLDETMRIESALLPVLVGMQLGGVPVDIAALDALAASKNTEVAEARERLRQMLGIDNPGSQKQLLPALKRAGLNVEASNAEALAPYRDHAVVRDLAKWRSGAKVAGDARALAEAARAQSDGRVRARWRQIAAPTGRMATSDPNVLGLPKLHSMRRCIAAPPGRTFIVADYAAIELRVLAHVTKDPRLTSIFRDGGDPHRDLAAILLGKDAATVTTDERKRAKPVNFGFAFGMGTERFVGYALKDYGVSFTDAEAQRFRAAYFAAYRQVDVWQRRTRATMDLEVRTCCGRARAFASRREGYTERLNMPIQGTAADGMKQAMVLLAPRLACFDACIVLAVHDELVVEAPELAAKEIEAIVVESMREGMSTHVPTVPIVVEASIGRTWSREANRS